MKSIITIFTLLALAGCAQSVKPPEKRLVKKPEYVKVADYRPDHKRCTVQAQKRLLRAVAKQCFFDKDAFDNQAGRFVIKLIGEEIIERQVIICIINTITTECGDSWVIDQLQGQRIGIDDLNWPGSFDCKYASLWTPAIQKVCAEFKEAKQ